MNKTVTQNNIVNTNDNVSRPISNGMNTTKPKTNNTRSNNSTDNRGGNRGGNLPAGKVGRGGGHNGDRKRPSYERPKPEFDQKMVSIRRVTRVVAGGRRMTFAVAIAIGDKKGSIGLGTGKGGDTAIAITKALRQAKKSMFKIKTTKDMSIPHEIKAKFSSSKLIMMPNRGKGLVAGSTVRDMLTLAGLKNITAKLHSGSKNKLNNARVAYKALFELHSTMPVSNPVVLPIEEELVVGDIIEVASSATRQEGVEI